MRTLTCRTLLSLLSRSSLHGPSAVSRASSTISYPLQLSSVTSSHATIYQESLDNPEKFWGDLGKNRLKWFKEFSQVMDCDMKQGKISWFNGGKINVSGMYYVNNQ